MISFILRKKNIITTELGAKLLLEFCELSRGHICIPL